MQFQCKSKKNTESLKKFNNPVIMFILDYFEIFDTVHIFIKNNTFVILSKSIILTFFRCISAQTIKKDHRRIIYFSHPYNKTHIIPNILFMIIHTVHNMGLVYSLLKAIILSVLTQESQPSCLA